MAEKLYLDRLTGQMRSVQRMPLLEHVYQQGANTNLLLDMVQRLADLERRGA